MWDLRLLPHILRREAKISARLSLVLGNRDMGGRSTCRNSSGENVRALGGFSSTRGVLISGNDQAKLTFTCF